MYKKLLSIFAVASTVFATNGFAQAIPNGDMETWVPQTGYSDPSGWATPNVLGSNATFFGNNPYSVSQDKSTFYQGTSSMKITTFKYTPGLVDITTNLPNDTIGFAFTGKLTTTAPYLYYGYPETNRYSSVSFYAKYTPVNGDSATCSVSLQRRNAGALEVIAVGQTTLGLTSTFTKFKTTLVYSANASIAGAKPDTAIVVFSSSKKKPQVNSTLWVDSISFGGLVPSGIYDLGVRVNALNVYPNPANEQVTLAAKFIDQMLSTIEIFDATGRKVENIAVQNNKTTVNTSMYAKGFYTYSAYNENKELVGVGKFSVTK